MKTLSVMFVAVFASAIGDALMSQGMKQVGDVSAMGGQVWKMLAMFGNPLVLLSIGCYAAYFFLYSSALSWADLSVAQPLNALGFVLTALIARFYLHENFSTNRWLGIAAIVAGVVLISLDQRPAP